MVGAGKHAEAEAAATSLLGDRMLRTEALAMLAIVAMKTDRAGDAVTHARRAVEAKPHVARYHFVLGRALKATDDRAGAATAYRRAIEIDPRYAEAMVSLGIVLKDQDDLDAAIDLYKRALRIDPGMAAAHANRAHALALRTQREAREGFDDEPDAETVDAQGRAVALDVKNSTLHRNYGVLLLKARRHAEAMAAFNEALTLDPTDVEACLRLGTLLQDLGATALAGEAYEKWLGRNAPNGPVMSGLAGILTLMGDADAALRWAERSRALAPDAFALLQVANVLQQLRRVEEALELSRVALDMGGRLAFMYPNVLLATSYLYEDPGPVLALHAEFGSRLPAPATRRPAPRPRSAGERLRIGYVSGDFVRHSVSYFATALLEGHDTDRFDVVCYQNNFHADEVTHRLKALGHRWVECAGLSDTALRRRIVDDGIDILIDLSGHTAHSRLMMFATPCAPVQIAYLGYPTVTGVPTIDHRITDGVIDAGDIAFGSETPLRMPVTMFCYTPDESPPIAPPPATTRGHVTFGSFNNVAKVTDHTLELWASVLQAVPGSRLLLKASTMAQASNREGIERFMAGRGVTAERLTLVARTPRTDSHLSLYNEVDIGLDTFPYNGATTTCEALWMGLPVVTLRGRTHTSRMGASILGAIGRADWVASEDAGYVATAAALAGDVAALAAWRGGARERLRASPLLARAPFMNAFERLLEEAWRRACHGAVDLGYVDVAELAGPRAESSA